MKTRKTLQLIIIAILCIAFGYAIAQRSESNTAWFSECDKVADENERYECFENEPNQAYQRGFQDCQSQF